MSSPDKPGPMRRRIRALYKQLSASVREARFHTAAGDDERDEQRRAEDERRKLLTGSAVLHRVLERTPLIPWLRRVLDEGLTRAHDRRLFRLKGPGPLIPPEDWEGWPGAEETLPAELPLTALSFGRRRARLAYLVRRIAAIREELSVVQTKYAPHRDSTNNQRMILVGAVFLAWSCRNDRVARWLRRILDKRYTAVKDRKLFLLEKDGPLLPVEAQAAERPARRQAAKVRVSDRPPAAAGETQRARSASSGPSDGGDAGTSARSNTASAPKAELHGDDAVTDVPEPIPSWRPHRLRDASASGSGGRSRRSVWGARLTGRAAVSALPADLRGRKISVTDSNQVSWTTTVTDVVSRDERTVVVRNTGRPRRDGAGSGHNQEPDSSSS